jgi:hypothetical protein
MIAGAILGAVVTAGALKRPVAESGPIFSRVQAIAAALTADLAAVPAGVAPPLHPAAWGTLVVGLLNLALMIRVFEAA